MAWVKNNAVLIQQGSDQWQRLLHLSFPIHSQYCLQHDFDYWCICGGCNVGPMEPQMSPIDLQNHRSFSEMLQKRENSWCMTHLMKQAMEDSYQYVIFLGVDALIIQTDYDLRKACPTDAFGLVWHEFDWKLEGEYSHFNVGNVFIGNGLNSRQLMQDWWDYPPHNHHWAEQHSLNMAYKERSVQNYATDPIVSIDPKFNSTPEIGSENPVVMAWHGQGELENRIRLMKEEIEKRGL